MQFLQFTVSFYMLARAVSSLPTNTGGDGDRCNRENLGRCDENDCEGQLRISFPDGTDNPAVREYICMAGNFKDCPCREGEVSIVTVLKRQATQTRPPPEPTQRPPPFLPLEQLPKCNGIEGRCDANGCNATFQNSFDTRGLCQGGKFMDCICQKCDGVNSCFENGCEGDEGLFIGDYKCSKGVFEGCPCAMPKKRDVPDISVIGVHYILNNGHAGPAEPTKLQESDPTKLPEPANPTKLEKRQAVEDIRVIGTHNIPAIAVVASTTTKPTAMTTLIPRNPQSIRDHGVHFVPAPAPALEPVPERPTPIAQP